MRWTRGLRGRSNGRSSQRIEASPCRRGLCRGWVCLLCLRESLLLRQSCALSYSEVRTILRGRECTREQITERVPSCSSRRPRWASTRSLLHRPWYVGPQRRQVCGCSGSGRIRGRTCSCEHGENIVLWLPRSSVHWRHRGHRTEFSRWLGWFGRPRRVPQIGERVGHDRRPAIGSGGVTREMYRVVHQARRAKINPGDE